MDAFFALLCKKLKCLNNKITMVPIYIYMFKSLTEYKYVNR